MKKSKHPQHIQTIFDNRDEVIRLLDIHKQLVGEKPGYKANVEVLNKSAIVLLVACWEAFIEDLASEAFEIMLKNAKSHEIFPTCVLTTATRDLKTSNDERKIWELAGLGWKDVLIKHKSKVIERYIGSLNTPRADNIDKLFKDLIGFPVLSAEWHWKAKSPENVRNSLSDLITLRGSIAHRVNASRSVRKVTVEKAIEFINRLCVISHNRVNSYLATKVGEEPWVTYYYQKVK